jgi:hypothetical protein
VCGCKPTVGSNPTATAMCAVGGIHGGQRPARMPLICVSGPFGHEVVTVLESYRDRTRSAIPSWTVNALAWVSRCADNSRTSRLDRVLDRRQPRPRGRRRRRRSDRRAGAGASSVLGGFRSPRPAVPAEHLDDEKRSDMSREPGSTTCAFEPTMSLPDAVVGLYLTERARLGSPPDRAPKLNDPGCPEDERHHGAGDCGHQRGHCQGRVTVEP